MLVQKRLNAPCRGEDMTSAEYAAILLMIGAFSLDYCNALRCYTCGSPIGGHCGKPLDTKHPDVKKEECHNVVSACLKAKLTVEGTPYKICRTCAKQNTRRLSLVSYENCRCCNLAMQAAALSSHSK